MRNWSDEQLGNAFWRGIKLGEKKMLHKISELLNGLPDDEVLADFRKYLESLLEKEVQK